MSSLYLDLATLSNMFYIYLYFISCFYFYFIYATIYLSDNVTAPTMTVAGMYNCTLLLEKITDDANAKLYVKSFLPFPLI